VEKRAAKPRRQEVVPGGGTEQRLEAEVVSGVQGSGIEKLERKAAASDSAGDGRTN
jgi:hypothetical protein